MVQTEYILGLGDARDRGPRIGDLWTFGGGENASSALAIGWAVVNVAIAIAIGPLRPWHSLCKWDSRLAARSSRHDARIRSARAIHGHAAAALDPARLLRHLRCWWISSDCVSTILPQLHMTRRHWLISWYLRARRTCTNRQHPARHCTKRWEHPSRAEHALGHGG